MICKGILGKIGIEKYETVEDELKLVIVMFREVTSWKKINNH